MTGRLVALDVPAGPAFVDALTRTWDDGDAAFPVDQRLPLASKSAQLAALAVTVVRGSADVDVPAAYTIPPGAGSVTAVRRPSGRTMIRSRGCRATDHCSIGLVLTTSLTTTPSAARFSTPHTSGSSRMR